MEQKIKQNDRGNIGKNIREIRVSKGIGQTEFGTAAGFTGDSDYKRMPCKNRAGNTACAGRTIKGDKGRTQYDV